LALSVYENSIGPDSTGNAPNKLGDLLQYQSPDGQYFYTMSVNSKLAGYFWHIPAGAK
jgi:hypothetical protein